MTTPSTSLDNIPTEVRTKSRRYHFYGKVDILLTAYMYAYVYIYLCTTGVNDNFDLQKMTKFHSLR